MKASEVIKKLQELVTKYGDCYVNAISWDTSDCFLLELSQLKDVYYTAGDGEEFFCLQYERYVPDFYEEDEEDEEDEEEMGDQE